MAFGPLPFFGSFQRGRLHQTDDALSDVWRRLERVATIETLRRQARDKHRDEAVAEKASIRLRQGIELRRVAREATILTRPLLLYYSALNLARGIMLAYPGEAGHPTHGLRFVSAPSLLDCTAQVCAKGTFPQFMQSLEWPPDQYEGKSFSLRQLLLMVPETLRDHNCIAEESGVCAVHVKALMDGVTTLRFHVRNLTADEFTSQWATILPWFADLCNCHSEPFTLAVRQTLPTPEAVTEFCSHHLLRDLRFRQDPVWYDYIATRIPSQLDRRGTYLAALFVLSNVTRYEPELLAGAGDTSTELGFFLETFLAASERFFPQLILELVEGPMYFT